MKLSKLTYLILELNSALDTGNYDKLPVSDATTHIDAGDVVNWLKGLGSDMDLGLLSDSDIAEYQAGLADILGAYAGKERRKWGVENRALCLLIAWTNELIQRGGWEPSHSAWD